MATFVVARRSLLSHRPNTLRPTTELSSVVSRVCVNTRGLDYAVGDIHGAFTALEQALEWIHFDPDRDRLFSVGDLVDRGPESYEAGTWLDKPWFHAICGNHDFMAWRSALGDPFADVEHRSHGGEWLDQLPADKREHIGSRLAALPLALEVETPTGLVGLVHADCPFDDWQDMHDVDVRSLGRMESAAGQCLWSIARYARGYTGVVKNVRAVVHGHITLPAMAMLGNAYFIDTGGWQRPGRFTFLNLHTLQAFEGPGGQFAPPATRRYR